MTEDEITELAARGVDHANYATKLYVRAGELWLSNPSKAKLLREIADDEMDTAYSIKKVLDIVGEVG